MVFVFGEFLSTKKYSNQVVDNNNNNKRIENAGRNLVSQITEVSSPTTIQGGGCWLWLTELGLIIIQVVIGVDFLSFKCNQENEKRSKNENREEADVAEVSPVTFVRERVSHEPDVIHIFVVSYK